MNETPSLRQLMKRWKDGGESIDDLAATYGIPGLERKIRQAYRNLNLPAPAVKPKPAPKAKPEPKLDKVPWTPEENAILVEGLRLRGDEMYAFLAANLPNRTTVAWQKHAHKLRLSYSDRRWTPEEQAMLAAGVQPPSRTAVACATRRTLLNKLAQQWTPEEDEALRRIYRERPKRQRALAFAGINHPPAACQMRWRQLRSADAYRKRKEAQDLRKQNRRTS